jgi:hypothetical protein
MNGLKPRLRSAYTQSRLKNIRKDFDGSGSFIKQCNDSVLERAKTKIEEEQMLKLLFFNAQERSV